VCCYIECQKLSAVVVIVIILCAVMLIVTLLSVVMLRVNLTRVVATLKRRSINRAEPSLCVSVPWFKTSKLEVILSLSV
jgi:hypothetical protein